MSACFLNILISPPLLGPRKRYFANKSLYYIVIVTLCDQKELMFSTYFTASGITLLSLSTFAIDSSSCLCFTRVPRLNLPTSKLKLLQPFPMSGDNKLAVTHTLSVIPRGGADGVMSETIRACYDWNVGLGAPAALIAGKIF